LLFCALFSLFDSKLNRVTLNLLRVEWPFRKCCGLNSRPCYRFAEQMTSFKLPSRFSSFSNVPTVYRMLEREFGSVSNRHFNSFIPQDIQWISVDEQSLFFASCLFIIAISATDYYIQVYIIIAIECLLIYKWIWLEMFINNCLVILKERNNEIVTFEWNTTR